VVLLPGAGSDAGDFEREGFLKKLQESRLSIDIIAANATLPYYMRETMVTRIYEDVVRNVLAQKNYQQRWVMGMSMGGFGSFYYAMHHPQTVDGVFALAPWLGADKLTDEIKKAGGLRNWAAPGEEFPTRQNYQRQLWRWLKAMTVGSQKGPELWLGYGTDDSLAGADSLVAAELPKERVLTSKGGHDWEVWNNLLERFLKEGPLNRECRANESTSR
jgi:S-formylglutathione hydrolase FrmB